MSETASIVDCSGSHELATTSGAAAWMRGLRRIEREHYPMGAAGKTTAQVCQPLIEMAVREAGCPLAQVWSVDPRRRRLILIGDEVASNPEFRDGFLDVLEADTSLTGVAVVTKRIQFFPVLGTEIGRHRFQCAKARERLHLRSMFSVPITNIGNPHQVMLVLNLFFATESADVREAELRFHARLLAAAVEANLRERAFRMAMWVAQRLGQMKLLTAQTAYRVFADCVREAVGADWVTVYVEDWSHSKVKRRADSEPTPRVVIADQC